MTKFQQFLLSLAAALAAHLLVVGAGVLLFLWWFNHPLGPHVPIPGLAEDYRAYWQWFWYLAAAAFLYLTAIVGLLVGILRKR